MNLNTSADLAFLIGESFTPDMPFGENMEGDLTNGYSVGESFDYIPAIELGDGVVGPPQVQDLVIWRDNRPLAVDELGMEGPWVIPWVKVSQPVEGKTFPLNYEFGAQFDRSMPGLTAEVEPDGLQSPYPAITWAGSPGVVEVLPQTNDLLYSTAGAGI